MPGNVAEWCKDTYIEERRIVRGGWWSSEYSAASYMSRLSYPPDEIKEFLGFRIVNLSRLRRDKFKLVKRINLPRDGRKNTLSREGMSFDGNLYFLPDDGPNSHIMIFTLD